MIDFLDGALTLAYLVAGAYFLRFWRRTDERLFLYFAIAFALLAANQFWAFLLGVADERTSYIYVLRILAFVIILFAIVGKNVVGPRPPPR
jgi:hypothetical protein